LLTASWNPFTKASATIITATLIAVATVASRMMKREKVFSSLEEIRRAMKLAIFKKDDFINL
jgi:hypothetical protein